MRILIDPPTPSRPNSSGDEAAEDGKALGMQPHPSRQQDEVPDEGSVEQRHRLPNQEAHPRRTAVGVLLNYTSFFSEGLEGRLRRAFDSDCARRDWDLYLIYGRALEEPDPSCPAYNAVFELIHPARMDAVILVSNLLAGYCGVDRLNEYAAARYARFPRCSIGMLLPSQPSLDVDNRPGMEALVEHLVTTHGYQRFAFMAGQSNHPHSKMRLQVCEEVLARHGLAIDPELIVYGDFMTHAAEVAMDELLARRGDFEVVVAANDAMAMGVIASLRKHGRSVPDDCAVTGFDDLIHARLGNPPMTTVSQPVEMLARCALSLVQAQLTGGEVPALTRVAGELFVRNSCGCSRVSSGALSMRAHSEESAVEHLRRAWGRIQVQIENLLGESRSAEGRTSERVLRALELELSGAGPALVALTRELLGLVRDDPEHFRAWYAVVEALEAEFEPYTSKALEAVWRGVQRELVHALTASHLQQQMAMDFSYVQLLGSEDNVFGALKLGALQESLRRHLPTVGIGTVSLSEYVEGEPSLLKPLVHFVEGVGSAAEIATFPAYWLFPPGPQFQTRKTFIVMPLVFESRGLGMSVLEYASGPIPYHLLRDQISAALGTYRLQREIEHQSALRERSVQERLATTRRLESLSILAGGVAHDLNNVLGPLVALPDIMLSQLETVTNRGSDVQDLQGDIELIKVAGQRASQTIKDLLTLSRQGRTPKSPIDVNQLLRECGEGNAARRLQVASTQIRVETAPEPLVILASEAHIVRAVTNLIQNALDAINDDGEVRLRSYACQLNEPLDCYETILPGEYVVIEVSDSGCGLPSDTRQRIFEPFFSTKHLGQGSGTGLGLAIVHGVVKEHDGFIDVESSPDVGTRFRLYLPRSRGRIVSVRPPVTRRAGGGRILVVDDEPIQLRTCKRVLTRCGYEVEVTSSGLEACQRVAQAAAGNCEGYDLVLLDVQLSEGEDGLDIYERILKVVPQQKAVLASGHAPTHRIEAALERGIPWLQKPYTADALSEIVRTAMDAEVEVPEGTPRLPV